MLAPVVGKAIGVLIVIPAVQLNEGQLPDQYHNEAVAPWSVAAEIASPIPTILSYPITATCCGMVIPFAKNAW